MRNVSTFGNTADIYALIHLVPHARQHLLNAIFAYCCLVAANQGNYVRGLFLKKTFSLYWRKNYHDPLRSLLLIFKNVSRTYE
jgi:hypothetical protein